MHGFSLLLAFVIFSLLKYNTAKENEIGFALEVRAEDQIMRPFCLVGIAQSENHPMQENNLPWMLLVDSRFLQGHSSNRLAVLMSTPFAINATTGSFALGLVADESQDPGLLTDLVRSYPWAVFARLAVSDFNQLSALTSDPNGRSVFVLVKQDEIGDSQSSRPFYVLSFVYACAFGSILFGSVIVILTRDELLQQLKERATQATWSKLTTILGIALFIGFASACLLIYYFFYDIAVYIAIALYFVISVLAVTHIVAFWIMYFFSSTRKRIPVNWSVCGRNVDFTLSVTQLAVFPFALVLLSVWLVFRNDPNVGWPMQSVIGVILVARILSAGLPLPSLKLITAVFALFLLYDVFFVFITPLLMKPSSNATWSTAPEAAQLSRQTRSLPEAKSVMEAIATGSAGHSGEALPVSFRFQVVYLRAGLYHCSRLVYRALLGYGDAVFPGFLCAYLAFFDSVWQVRFRRNFLASLVGYLLGIGLTQFVLNLMDKAQPALLYLCPSTLGLTVLASGLFGGLDELRRMWNGAIPAMVPDDCVIFQSTQDDSFKEDAVHEMAPSPVVQGDLFAQHHSQISLVPHA